MENKTHLNKYTCNEYRDEMILVALRKQLARTDLTQQERRWLEEEIRIKENEIGL